jgi:hypothetical protein
VRVVGNSSSGACTATQRISYQLIRCIEVTRAASTHYAERLECRALPRSALDSSSRGDVKMGVGMRRSLTYADAVRILGGGESAVIKGLDTASTVGLIALGGFNFFEVRQELVKLGTKLTTRLSDQIRGLDRLSRTDRLLAAHTVVVITAYFEAVGDAFALLGLDRTLGLGANEQVALLRGRAVEPKWKAIISELTETSVDEPSPFRTRKGALEVLLPHYRRFGAHVAEYVACLPPEALDVPAREQVSTALAEHVPQSAIGRYEERIRELASDCAEFGVWVNLTEHEMTRTEIQRGLAGLEALLLRMTSGAVPSRQRVALVNAYQAMLDRPITLGGEFTGRLQIPTLREGYIDHRFQAAELDASAEPGRESWWEGLPVRSDVHHFLAGFLTGPRARQAPLLILGQPGSGKSVLTRVLAARLPANDFLPLHVELRQTPAEADLQDQIEAAVRAATGEMTAWPRLVESAQGALPVVILDGFDELLQATGVSHTDFLLKTAAFQQREAAQGRAVAVVVTSRIAVADRAALPAGAVGIRLQPFDDGQVGEWLDGWHRTNRREFHESDRVPLQLDTVLAHRELAEQPLLLLMLAIFDAHGDALRGDMGRLSRTELYEQLLEDFARREVRKTLVGASEPDTERAVEAELLRLSVVAFAMFNRRSQWIHEDDLNADLAALLGAHDRRRAASGFRAPLTAAEIVVGRFFFVHESRATRDGQTLQTYEFLHSTFGEFLVARLVVHVLVDIANRQDASAFALPGGVDDGLAFALLSFAALTARMPVVEFLTDLIERLSDMQRASLSTLLLRLHAHSLEARDDSAFGDYEPLPISVTRRHAAWSANLVLLVVLTAGEVTGSELFSHRNDDPGFEWHDLAMMWRAQLSSEEFHGLVETIALDRMWSPSGRDLRLRRDDGTFDAPPIDMSWTYIVPAASARRRESVLWLGHTPQVIRRATNFTAGKSADMMTHALHPVSKAFPIVANMLVSGSSGEYVSATQALLTAFLATYQRDDAPESAYQDLLRAATLIADNKLQAPDRVLYVTVAADVLAHAVERGAAPSGLLPPLLRVVDALTPDDPRLVEVQQRLRMLSASAHALPSAGEPNGPPADEPARIRIGRRVESEDGGRPEIRYEAI